MCENYAGFDRLSYQLGMVAAFCEMVQQGVKRLALGPPMQVEDLPVLEPACHQIAQRYGVHCWTDRSFLPSDLANEQALCGKAVILLHRDEAVLAEYQALKARRTALLEQMSPAEADAAITPALRRLLGYPA